MPSGRVHGLYPRPRRLYHPGRKSRLDCWHFIRAGDFPRLGCRSWFYRAGASAKIARRDCCLLCVAGVLVSVLEDSPAQVAHFTQYRIWYAGACWLSVASAVGTQFLCPVDNPVMVGLVVDWLMPCRWIAYTHGLDVKMIYLIIAIAIIYWFVYEFVTAPVGWEDEEGFHYGKK